MALKFKVQDFKFYLNCKLLELHREVTVTVPVTVHCHCFTVPTALRRQGALNGGGSYFPYARLRGVLNWGGVEERLAKTEPEDNILGNMGVGLPMGIFCGIFPTKSPMEIPQTPQLIEKEGWECSFAWLIWVKKGRFFGTPWQEQQGY